MKYLKYKITGIFLVLIIFLGGCKKAGDFGTTNVSPNSAVVPLPSALLTDAIYRTSSALASSRSFQTNPTLYVQWLMQTQYPDEAQYATAQIDWATFYVNPLENLQKIIQYNTDEKTKDYAANSGSNANQIAVARIYKAYLFSMVTDMYGDVPYTDALQGKSSASYTPQDSIYKDLIKELTEAVAQFDAGSSVKGDILLSGSAARWKKFANSLRMTLSLRLSKVYPGATDYAATEFKKALGDPAGYVDNNTDNVVYNYLSDDTYRNPWNAQFDGRADYAPSQTFVDTLMSYNDPRTAVYFTKNGSGSYSGIPYGLKRDDLLSWENAHPNWSLMGDATKSRTAPGQIITAAQIKFTRAEAAQLGWTTENAETLYNDGIKASWQQWAVYDDAKYAAYIANPLTAFSSNPLREINTQKWIALYPNQQFEAWSEWRRTGYPKLIPAINAVNQSKQIPRRYQYPANEPTLNGVNYKAAVSRLSAGDTDNSRIWWDKP